MPLAIGIPQVRERSSSEAPRMTWWPLFEMPDGRWFDDERTMLIGDAAHAMTPFAAQGAAMAIEDGYELAQASRIRRRRSARGKCMRYENRSPRAHRIGRETAPPSINSPITPVARSGSAATSCWD
jgi:salicylate hydroxylase